jgi:hypothetical protein
MKRRVLIFGLIAGLLIAVLHRKGPVETAAASAVDHLNRKAEA